MITKLSLELLDSILSYLPADATFDIATALNQYFADPRRNDFPLIRFQEHEEIFQTTRQEIERFLIDYEFAVNKSNILTRPDRQTLLLTNSGISLKNAGSYKMYIDELGIVQEPNQLMRLDWMLDFMSVHTVQGRDIESCWKEIKKLHPTIHIEGNESYREQMIKKLVADGFMEYNDGQCKITWEGTIFQLEGGYTGRYSKQNEEKARLQAVERTTLRNNKATLWLTVVIAVFGVPQALYNIQETKSVNWLFSFKVTVCIEIFIFGLLGGLTLYLLRDEIKSRRK